MKTKYRAVFEYPDGRLGFGPARATFEEAAQDRPWRPEESRGVLAGVQTCDVGRWTYVPE